MIIESDHGIDGATSVPWQDENLELILSASSDFVPDFPDSDDTGDQNQTSNLSPIR